MEQDQLNAWICSIAKDKILAMAKNLDRYTDRINDSDKTERPNLMLTFNNSLVNQHNEIHEILKQMKGAVENIEDDEEYGQIITPEELKSRTYTILANYLRLILKPDEALDYAEKSFNLFPNQIAKYLIAKCIEDSKLQTGALSSFKKKQEVQQEKDKRVISEYLDTIQMDPSSNIAKTSGERLINKYKYNFEYRDVFKAGDTDT